MKKILGLALAGALSFAALPAVAADYPMKAPPPPIWTWTGFYVGINAGVGWDAVYWTAGAVRSGDGQGTGALVGGTLGWNWQAPGSPWVFGIEGDFGWSNIGTVGIPGCGGPCTSKLDSLATLRARLGHANGPLLFYLTGGGAWGAFKNSVTIAPAHSEDAWGWVVGGGLEGALGGGWSLKAEYIFARFDQTLACTPADGCGVNNFAHFSTHIVRAGINYKF